jgi:hypothetical protein
MNVTNILLIFVLYVTEYLKQHKAVLLDYRITTTDCAKVFHREKYDGNNNEVLVREKWRFIGQCLARICTKSCSWLDIVVRAAGVNECNYTYVAEEAIVYWLFVSKEEGWFSTFEQKYVLMDGDDMDEVDDSIGRTQHKRCGTHKTHQQFLKHWWQHKAVYKARRENREISKEWDAAWMKFAAEELEMKNNKKQKHKQKHVDVLPSYEDVLGIGETECIKIGSTGAVLEEDAELLCTQKEEV